MIEPAYYVFFRPDSVGELRQEPPGTVFVSREWELGDLSPENGDRIPVFVCLREEPDNPVSAYRRALFLVRSGELLADDGLSVMCTDVTLASLGYFELRKRAERVPEYLTSPEGLREMLRLLSILFQALLLEIPELSASGAGRRSSLWNFPAVRDAVSGVLESFRDRLLLEIRRTVSESGDGFRIWRILFSGMNPHFLNFSDGSILSENVLKKYYQDFNERCISGDLYLRANSIFSKINSCPRERYPLLLRYWLSRDTQAMITDFCDRLAFYLGELLSFISGSGGTGGIVAGRILREINSHITEGFFCAHGLCYYAFFKKSLISYPDINEAVNNILREREKSGSTLSRIFPRERFPDARAVLEEFFFGEDTLFGRSAVRALGESEIRSLTGIFRKSCSYDWITDISEAGISRENLRLRNADAVYEVTSDLPELYGSSFLKLYLDRERSSYHCFMEKRNQFSGSGTSLSGLFRMLADFYTGKSRRECYVSGDFRDPLREVWKTEIGFDSLRLYVPCRSGENNPGRSINRVGILYGGVFPGREAAALSVLAQVFRLTSFKIMNREFSSEAEMINA